MRDSASWSLLSLAVGFVLAVLGLPDKYEWLQSYLLVASVCCLVLSTVCFAWPLRKVENRDKCKELCKHPVRAIKLIEPLHIVAVGLVIALAGVIWHWRQPPTPDPQVAALRTEVANLQTALATALQKRAPVPVATGNPPMPPPQASATPVKNYDSADVRKLLDALTTAQKMVDEVVAPPYFQIESLMMNPEFHNSVKGYVQKLRDLSVKIRNEVWPQVDGFVYKANADYKDEMRYAFALEQEATKGESLRKLDIAIEAIKELPENPPENLTKLVQPQMRAAAAEIQPHVYTWIGLSRRRIPAMMKSLRENGTIKYDIQ